LSYFVVMHAPNSKDFGAAIFAMIIAAFFVGISIHLLLFYQRAKLVISDEEIESTGVVQVKRMSLADVTGAVWRLHPSGGSLVLRTRAAKITVYFDNYQPRHRAEIVDFFSTALPQSVQEGWTLFSYRIAGHYGQEDREPGDGEVRLTRSKMNIYIAVGVLAACFVGVYCWWVTADIRFLFAPLVMGSSLFVVQLRIPRKGMIFNRLSHRPDEFRFLCFILVSLAVGIGDIMVCAIFELRLALPVPTMFVILAIWVSITLIWAHRIDKRQRRRDIEAAEKAAQAPQSHDK